MENLQSRHKGKPISPRVWLRSLKKIEKMDILQTDSN